MRRSILLLLLTWWAPFASSQTNSPAPQFTEHDLRQLLGQLYELQSSRTQIVSYADFVKREAELHEQEKANWQKSLELEKQATGMAQKERDLVQEKADLYKSLYDAAKKKPGGVGCFFKRFFSAGLARCGG